MVSFDNQVGQIWYNGELVPWRDTKIHVLTHGLHYASCVFEGERVYNGKVFRLREHTQRFIESGLALGGSLDNAVVISGDNILNQDGLRYRDEFVRHKVLDLIGDLYLADFRIVGEVFAEKSGHNLNKLLLDNLHNQKDAYVVDQTDGTFRDWSEVLVAASA